jgi:transcriptional regulator with XRE-family HTH domain
MYSERVESCGKRLAKALEIRKLRQADLAEMTQIPKSSISLYLKGAYEPKDDRIYVIAKALRVSEAWLMGYDVPMEKIEEISPSEPQLTGVDKELWDILKLIPVEKKRLMLEMGRAFVSNLHKD